jgi:hypothetical protein
LLTKKTSCLFGGLAPTSSFAYDSSVVPTLASILAVGADPLAAVVASSNEDRSALQQKLSAAGFRVVGGDFTSFEELEAELLAVNTVLAKARSRENTLHEERDAFEESSTEVLDHLRKAMTRMEALAIGYTFEGSLVVKGLTLVDSMFMVDETARAGVEKSQETALEALERGLSRSALWHANCSLEAITRVVMTLKNYALELEEVIRSSVSDGAEVDEAETMLKEMLGRRHQLEDLYAQVELEGLDVLHQHAVMTSERDFVSSVCGGFQTDEAKMVDSALQDLISQIGERSAEFYALNRPGAQLSPTRSPPVKE